MSSHQESSATPPLSEVYAAELLTYFGQARNAIDDLANFSIKHGADSRKLDHLPDVWSPEGWLVLPSSTEEITTGATNEDTGIVRLIEGVNLRTVVHEGIHRAAALGRQQHNFPLPIEVIKKMLAHTEFATDEKKILLARKILVEGITECTVRRARRFNMRIVTSEVSYGEEVKVIESLLKAPYLKPFYDEIRVEALLMQAGLSGDFESLLGDIGTNFSLALVEGLRRQITVEKMSASLRRRPTQK